MDNYNASSKENFSYLHAFQRDGEYNSPRFIEIRGARENNLKNISLKIPKNKLVVLTGISGSGKSTLAFDTLQKECQRQYMASLGMVTDFVSKPKVDSIIGLSPSIREAHWVKQRLYKQYSRSLPVEASFDKMCIQSRL